MSLLVNLDKISLAFGLDILLDHVQLQIHRGERICLIGRNGAGKSSLMKIIAGQMTPDSGQIFKQPHLRMAYLAQTLPSNLNCSVYDYVATGLENIGALLTEYHTLTHHLATTANAHTLTRLSQLQAALDANNGWQFSQTINTTLTRLQLNPEQPLHELSGGWQRRAALARALVSTPELLLLDEPTNHLDISAISWLEEELLNSSIGLLFITHDRSLLQRLATRIIELDRGHLTSWPGDYAHFLRHKAELLASEAKFNVEFDKKLAREETWIRQGIKARRTRNEGRVRALEAMRRERVARRERQGKASFNINQQTATSQLVAEARQIHYSIGERCLIKNFSIRILRGDRIGLIGANGMGKSTLLAILLGSLSPQQGSVTLGTQLNIAYFDQLRSALDLEKNAIENLNQGSDEITINVKKQHVMSYLQDFLFTPERARTAVKALSGGECNRLLLARLFAQPSNLLVLDEPTNDLDIETLELLEELLNQYQGTLLLVSHDRTFLNQVVTSTIVFEGEGQVTEYVGGYDDWLRQARSVSMNPATDTTLPNTLITETAAAPKKDTGLTYLERKELAKLPQKIEKLEAAQQALQAQIAAPGFYQQPTKKIDTTLNELGQLDAELNAIYERWQELEDKQ